MNFIKNQAGVIAVVALIIAIVAWAGTHAGKSTIFGATSCSSITCLSGGLRLVTGAGGDFEVDVTSSFTAATAFSSTATFGSSGTAITQMITGTGALIYSNPSVTASTTLPFDIAVTGVVDGDKVFVQTATTTANGAGWLITGASASTTAGFITLRVANNSGATGVIPRNIASSTPYLIIR